MSINTQKLLDEIERRYAALDSTSSLSELQRVSELNTRKDAPILTGAIQYGSLNQANAPSGIGDSAKVGEIFFVADQQLDSNGRFYFRSQEGFINMKTALDSSENASITTAASAGGGAPSTPFQSAGSSRAYIANGFKGPTYSATVEKFLFAASANATNVSGLTLNWAGSAVGGSRSTTDGYAAGGYTAPGARVKTIDKFPFASEDAVADQGDVLAEKNFLQSMPIVSTTHGYFVGGFPSNNQIQKFAFASTGNTTDTGDLINSHNFGMGTNSAEYGYSLQDNTNQRWPFASDGNAVDVGDASPATSSGINRGASFQTTAIGYYAGGRDAGSPGTLHSHIQKFPFASGTVNMTDTTYDLSDSKMDMMSASSSTHGYRAGGTPPSVNLIERYTFASEANVADVGDLTGTRSAGASSYV